MEKRKKSLGRGLQALIDSDFSHFEAGETNDERNPSPQTSSLLQISVDSLLPNPQQARSVFNEEKLEELALSISQLGVLQPIIVTSSQEALADEEQKYTIIAGERRWRSAKKAGLSCIPAVCVEINMNENIEASLSENTQREDLSPIEFAKSLRAYLEISNYTHDEASQKLGKSRPLISNALRLLSLPAEVQNAVHRGVLSHSHARLLLSLQAKEQLFTFNEIISQSLNVRQTEQFIASLHSPKNKKTSPRSKGPSNSFAKEIEQQLIEKFGTHVSFSGSLNGGKISLHYYSKEDLHRLLSLFDMQL